MRAILSRRFRVSDRGVARQEDERGKGRKHTGERGVGVRVLRGGGWGNQIDPVPPDSSILPPPEVWTRARHKSEGPHPDRRRARAPTEAGGRAGGCARRGTEHNRIGIPDWGALDLFVLSTVNKQVGKRKPGKARRPPPLPSVGSASHGSDRGMRSTVPGTPLQPGDRKESLTPMAPHPGRGLVRRTRRWGAWKRRKAAAKREWVRPDP